MANAQTIRVTLTDGEHEFLNVTFSDIQHKFHRYTRKLTHLVPIESPGELYEGMDLEYEGAWFELFLVDFVNKEYWLERRA